MSITMSPALTRDKLYFPMENNCSARKNWHNNFQNNNCKFPMGKTIAVLERIGTIICQNRLFSSVLGENCIFQPLLNTFLSKSGADFFAVYFFKHFVQQFKKVVNFMFGIRLSAAASTSKSASEIFF